MSDAAPSRRAPNRYELRVLGHLDPHWSTWLTGLTLTHEDDGSTSLRGTVADQAELHGLLAKVRDLGVTLLSVTPADTNEREPVAGLDAEAGAHSPEQHQFNPPARGDHP
jgi:glycine/D-amino acid oxidase-like deaminating enzyme